MFCEKTNFARDFCNNFDLIISSSIRINSNKRYII